MIFGQIIGKLLVRRLGEDSLLPEVRRQVGVGTSDGSISCLGEVSERSGATLGGGIAILYSSHGQQLLGDRGRDNASTTRRWDEPHQNRTALACMVSKIEKFKTRAAKNLDLTKF